MGFAKRRNLGSALCLIGPPPDRLRSKLQGRLIADWFAPRWGGEAARAGGGGWGAGRPVTWSSDRPCSHEQGYDGNERPCSHEQGYDGNEDPCSLGRGDDGNERGVGAIFALRFTAATTGGRCSGNRGGLPRAG
jgi:hypothetical protein